MTPTYVTHKLTRCSARHSNGRKCSQIVLHDGETVVQHTVFRDSSGKELRLCRTCANRADVVAPVLNQGFLFEKTETI